MILPILTIPCSSTILTGRDFSVQFAQEEEPTLEELFAIGDLGPEGLSFIPSQDSPNKRPLLVVTNEVSGTTTIFAVEKVPESSSILSLLGLASLGWLSRKKNKLT